MISVRNVTKTYVSQAGTSVKALNDISFELPDNGMVFLLGKSGSGKTTLLNLLGGLDYATEGEITVDSSPVSRLTEKDCDSYRNSYVGFVFQEYNAIAELTVGENISLALELRGEKANGGRISKALGLVGLEGYENRRISELSGGQKQRVAIARALVKNPRLILADEPTGALDSETEKQIFGVLKELSRERLVVVVSHDRDFAETYADRIIEFSDGRIISDSMPENARNRLDGVLTMQKTKLPIKTTIKLGVNSIRCRKARFISVVALSMVAFILFGVSDMFRSYDRERVYSASSAAVDGRSLTLKKEKNIVRESGSKWYGNGFMLSDEDIDDIVSRTGVNVRGCYVPAYAELNIERNYGRTTGLKNDYGRYAPKISCFTEFSEEDLFDFGFSLIAGRMPVGGKNEIAVSKYLYESFALASYEAYKGPRVETRNNGTETKTYTWEQYQNGEADEAVSTDLNTSYTSEITALSSPEDIVGKTIFVCNRNYTITGVIDTGFDSTEYAGLVNPAARSDKDGLNIEAALKCGKIDSEREYGLITAAFVGYGHLDGLMKLYPSVVKVDGFELVFENKYYSLKFDTFMRLSDIDTSRINLNWNGQGSYVDQATGKIVINRGNVLESLDDTQIIVPREMILNSIVLIGDKSYYSEFSDVPWEVRRVGFRAEGISDDGLLTVSVLDAEIVGNTGGNTKNGYEIDAVALSDSLFRQITEGRSGKYMFAVAAKPSGNSAVSALLESCAAEANEIRYTAVDTVSYELNTFESLFQKLATIFMYVSLGLMLFSALLLYFFISQNINRKKRDIGILRALGAGSSDVFKVLFSESFIIAAVIFLLSALFTFVSAFIVNSVLRAEFGISLTLLSFEPRQLGILAALSLVIAFVSSVFPIWRMAKRKPVELINDLV